MEAYNDGTVPITQSRCKPDASGSIGPKDPYVAFNITRMAMRPNIAKAIFDELGWYYFPQILSNAHDELTKSLVLGGGLDAYVAYEVKSRCETCGKVKTST